MVGTRHGEWFPACSGCCPRLRVKPKCRSLDSLRSLGMTRGSLRSLGMTGRYARLRTVQPFRCLGRVPVVKEPEID